MTLETAFELGQFAYRLKDHGADGLYDDFMKIVEKLMGDKPSDTVSVPVINQPSPYVTKPWTNDPLAPWKITCSMAEKGIKSEAQSDV